MAKYMISPTGDGRNVFTLETGGKVVLTSEPYTSTSKCIAGVNQVREVCRNYAGYNRNLSPTFQFYFTLSTVNGKLLGTSGFFDTAVEMGKGIEHLRKVGLTELIEVIA